MFKNKKIEKEDTTGKYEPKENQSGHFNMRLNRF